MAVIEVQDILRKGADGIFYSLRGNYINVNGIFQQFKPGDGIKGADGNWYVLKELIKHIRDPKDNQLYPVKLMPDGNWWMTVNYAFAGNGWVYNDDETHRAAYGGLYDFDTAMANVWDGVALPSYSQWLGMVNSVGGADVAGRVLKSKLNEVDNGTNSAINPTWLYNSSALGVDSYGFGILPAGRREGNTPSSIEYIFRGRDTLFWTSTLSGNPVRAEVNYGDIFIHFGSQFLDYTGMSVRYIVTDTSIIL